MKAWEIVGFTFDASMYCPECAVAAHGPRILTKELQADRTGNAILPIFVADEGWMSESCDDCGSLLGE